MKKPKGVIQDPKLYDDGSLYFALEEMFPDGKHGRFMECKMEHEDSEWVLYANDSEIVRF